MILTKTPLRIPLAGGGTDLPLFTNFRNGKVLSMAINQYIYTYIFKRAETSSTIVQTSNLQEVKINTKIKHHLIRETLKYFKIKEKIHVGFFSTMPTRSGIGSSSSLVVGLISSILKLKKIKKNKKEISNIAIKIERMILKEKGGIQDQIIASFGGLNLINCFKKYKFTNIKIKLKKKDEVFLEKKLILVFSKKKRYSTDIIKTQKTNSIKQYLEVKNEVTKILNIIKKNSTNELGEIFHKHWERKKRISNKMSNEYLDKVYDKINSSSLFLGGKLIGAGGGGFFLFVTKNQIKAKKFLKKNNYDFSNFKIDKLGVRTTTF